ncbi:MAG: hypothetical protein ABI603_16700, partial [Acidobacteriota bacterium]
MRLDHPLPARCRTLAAWTLLVAGSAGAMPVFAQAPAVAPPPLQLPAAPTAAPPAASGPQFQLTADEAVRMALENNLGIRAERLSPQIQTL